MASPVPAKSQPLHNFSLPHLKWKNHRTSPPRHPSRRPSPLHKQSADVTNQRKRTSTTTSSSKICIKIVSTSASEAALEDDESLQKTWNLRPRRPAMNHNVMKIGSSSSVTENKTVGNKEVNESKGGNDEKQKFSVALTRDEIEEDIFMLTGMKPARRPKKRPRTVQKQLDTVFPGLWLGSITADSYKVSENPPKV